MRVRRGRVKRSARSKTATRAPARARRSAAYRPADDAPITATSRFNRSSPMFRVRQTQSRAAYLDSLEEATTCLYSWLGRAPWPDSAPPALHLARPGLPLSADADPQRQ